MELTFKGCWVVLGEELLEYVIKNMLKYFCGRLEYTSLYSKLYKEVFCKLNYGSNSETVGSFSSFVAM